MTNFVRIGYTHQDRLARVVSSSTPPLGEYTCEVPEPATSVVHNASIIINQEGNISVGS